MGEAQPEYIFKVVSRDVWNAAVAAGSWAGAPVDLADGFIHFSSGGQVRETVAKHFAGQHDLMLIAFDAKDFGESLKWEPSRGGALFPHLYAPLDPALAKGVWLLPLGDDGTHLFPEELTIA